MTRLIRQSFVAAFALLSASFAAQDARPAEILAGSPEAQPPVCIEVRAEVRYGALAYDHIVHLTNVCDATQTCTVTTDVNPQPVEVSVQGHREIEVVTFRGSPAREFVPRVVCHPQ